MVLEKIDYDPFFYPKSIAIVGVPRKDYRFGGLSYLSKLQECGFPGKLYPINPKAGEISGFKVYPALSSLPEVPDLAIVSVTAEKVPMILEECALIGLRHIHILSSGFKEIGTEEGKDSRNKSLPFPGKSRFWSSAPIAWVPIALLRASLHGERYRGRAAHLVSFPKVVA